eukprot:CAMPEP_0113239754 /NCGR_PEP_ID=MMETSP0008_2-20120614/5891_1 /TAXON_ID=97485 /ORGANISM="Prymnesium parvum" /LENGTH=68 /DNA_ID=CAMNT_0000087035 /DNA_START=227 /DNA_END=430 /DNA_ORIENTATION=- /assembly_acc=CAM_ASM_000153
MTNALLGLTNSRLRLAREVAIQLTAIPKAGNEEPSTRRRSEGEPEVMACQTMGENKEQNAEAENCASR